MSATRWQHRKALHQDLALRRCCRARVRIRSRNELPLPSFVTRRWGDIRAFHKLFVAHGGGKQAVLSDLPTECAILISFLGARGPIIEL
jgi:hypothetical protein